MCIIVDANVLGNVFNKKNDNHSEFRPVLDWVIDGKGKFVIGGTKYLKECGKYLRVFAELRRNNKTVAVDDKRVDQRSTWVESQIQDPDFDDPHLVGLLIESGCRLICSLDARAYPFFQHQKFFRVDHRPKIYSRKSNADLLTDANMCELCKPAKKLTVAEKEKLTTL